MINTIKRVFKEMKVAKDTLKYLPQNRRHSKMYCYLDMLVCIAKYGALPEDYISLKFCDKPAEERKKYITAKKKKLFLKTMYTQSALDILTDKPTFYRKFKEYVTRDWVYTGYHNTEEIQKFLDRHEKVLIKPISSTWGKGIMVKNSHSIDAKKLQEEYGDVILEEVLKNHESLKKLNPSSLQTLRVETAIDSKGEFHLLNVLLMMGTKDVIVSNCHSGGCMAHINVEKGEVDAPGWNPNGIEYEIHPSSKINLIGYKVPKMEELEEYIKKVSSVMPEARYVGWDVTILENGEFELIEGNYCPGQCTQTCDGVPKYEMVKSYI